jgi:hypothetical protein
MLLALALTFSGCDDDNPTPPTAPTPPPTTTDTFSGMVNRNGGVTHTFATQASGTATATLTALSPDSALVVGFSMGTWNGTVCQIVLANDRATQGTVVIGGVSTLSSFCMRIYDVGNIVDPIAYEFTVVHP